MKKKVVIIVLVIAVIGAIGAIGGLVSSSAGDNRTWKCSECDKTFKGAAYYDYRGDGKNVLCADCARGYWFPLSYKDYKVE